MFSLETRTMSRGPLTSFSMVGLTRILVSRQFSMVFSRRCPVKGMASIVVNRNIIVVRNRPFLRGTSYLRIEKKVKYGLDVARPDV